MYSFQHTAVVRTALGVASAAALAGAFWQTLQLSRATHLGQGQTADSLAAAKRLNPEDADLWMAWAAAADADESTRALERAVSLNPAASTAWIRLGARAEAAADFPRAEYYYRQAAAVNRQFQPAWNLANYFFRRKNVTQFNLWAARALRMSYGDPRPLFDFYWRVEEKPDLVLDAARGRPGLVRLYLAYLTADGRLDAAETVARELVPLAGADDVPDLAAYCSRVLDSGTAGGALRVWNELCRRRLIPYAPLAPERGQSLTNGDFVAAPSSLGFDWRIVPWNGVAVGAIPQPACLRISFSGEQPESCQILTQTVPLAPARTYRLSYDYRTPGIQDSGLRWRVYGVPDNAELATAPPQLTSPEWTRQEMAFSTGPGCRLARLVLEYRKTAGATPIEGSLWLRRISLD
jgi:tetratricopeptide (TPR) repeat protein